MTLPITVHGFPIVAAFHTMPDRGTREGHVILVDRGQGWDPHRYVTGWLGKDDENWSTGHYFHDLGEAEADFIKRSERRF